MSHFSLLFVDFIFYMIVQVIAGIIKRIDRGAEIENIGA